MASASKSDVPRLSKWHLAIALGIGTPIALGFAYWYCKRNKNPKKSKPPSEDFVENSLIKNKIKEQHNKKSSKENGKQFVPETPYEKAKAFKDKGNKLFKDGSFDKAVECYTSAIEICPSQYVEDIATYYQNRAAAFENLRNFSAVINDATKALEYNKTYVKALYRRGKAYEEIGQLQNCLEDITAVCMMDGFQNDAYLKMTDRVLKVLSKKKAAETFSQREPRLPSKHFARHYFISFSEDPVMKSVEEYKKQAKDVNTTELSGFRLVIHHLAEENFEEVIPNCNVEIQRSGPDLAEALLVRGTFKLLQGQLEDSLADFNRLLSLESVDVKARVNCLIKIGAIKVQGERMDAALEDFNRAIELDLNNADIYLHRGQVFLLMERIDDCLKDMEKSCLLNPEFPSAQAQKFYIQYRCGIQYNDESQKRVAMKGFEDIENKFPNCSESFFLYAQVLCECGEFEKAEAYFKKTGELDPNDPNVFVHRGILLIQWKQNIEGALELFNKAIEMDHKCQFGYETLGTIEVQRGNLHRGLDLLQNAVDSAHTETELAHLYSLLLAAKAQAKVAESLGLDIRESN